MMVIAPGCYIHATCIHLLTCSNGPHSLLLELHHLVSEPTPLLPNHIPTRHHNVLKEQLCRVRGVVPDLVNLLGHCNSLAVHGDTDEGLVLVRRAITCVGKETDPVGLATTGDPHLTTVDHKIVTTCESCQ